MRFKYLYILLALLVVACNPEIDREKLSNPEEINPGKISAEHYLAIGDEFTAGFHDNELFFSGQLNSYSSILSRGLILFGGVPPRIAFMHDELGFGKRLRLDYEIDCNGARNLGLVPYGGNPSPENHGFFGDVRYKHFGVPGMCVANLDDSDYHDNNPYWKRLVGENFDGDVTEAIIRDKPSFFTLWLGMNDALDWAKQGGYNLQGSFPFPTPDVIFQRNYRRMLDSLKACGASGVVANIPRFVDFPFFELIPRNALVLTQEQADQLNLIYTANPFVSFKRGPNYFVVRDGAQVRHITENERILLSVDLDSVKCGGYGSVIPFDGPDVLLRDEISVIDQNINSYNAIIDSLASNRNFPVLDLNSWYKRIADEGVVWNGVATDFEFVTGGFFSLDGIYPTQRGAALISNAFSEKISQEFGTQLPLTDPNDFRGVDLP